VLEVVKLIEISRAYERMNRMVDSSQDLSRRAVERLGRTNKELIDARLENRSHGHERPADERGGHLQQHRQHEHGRLQASEGRVPGPDVPERGARRRATSDTGTVRPPASDRRGREDGATYRITEQGAATRTENRYDLAIDGQGFFQVLLPSGETAYTRPATSASTTGTSGHRRRLCGPA
jgi:hypothetical protein